jgi:hypothetical protein
MSDGESLARRMAADRAEKMAARRRRNMAWVAALVVVIVLAVGGRQFYRWAKVRRAAQFAAEAGQFAAAGKNEEAAKRYRAALQLDPLGYSALQGAARLASKLSRPEAADLWREVIRLREATKNDKQEYVRALMSLGKVKAAEPTLTQLLQNDPDAATLLLAARYSRTMGDLSKAIQFARIAVQKAPDKESVRFALAELLAASASAPQHEEARKILWEIAGKEGAFQTKALESIAAAPELTAEERDRVVQLLEPHTSEAIRDALLVADLRLQADPEDSTKIFDQTIARWGESSPADLYQLAHWLNLHNQAERVLSLLTVDRAMEDNQLLLSRLDALATLQRWNEIESFLIRPDLTLDPYVLESFRARTSQEKNANLDAEVHWNHAISLAANDPNKLRFVATFAEQSHASGVALRAYEQLAKIPEHAVGAYLATERLSAMNADTAVQRDAAEKIARLSPNDTNAADQLAYLNLLLNRDVGGNAEKAKALALKDPTRLSYRVTAALGYLRMNDPGPALAEFQPPAGGPAIEWENTPAGWRAVYAATLIANEKTQEAEEILKNIPRDRLSPEEKQLIEAKK